MGKVLASIVRGNDRFQGLADGVEGKIQGIVTLCTSAKPKDRPTARMVCDKLEECLRTVSMLL